MCHRTAASEIIEQAPLALPVFGRGDLVGKVHVTGTTRLRETGEERLGALKFVERQVAAAPCRHRDDDLRNPVGMRGAAGNVDHGKTGLGLVAGAEESAVLPLEKLQSLAV